MEVYMISKKPCLDNICIEPLRNGRPQDNQKIRLLYFLVYGEVFSSLVLLRFATSASVF